jgi:hypothetical protein
MQMMESLSTHILKDDSWTIEGLVVWDDSEDQPDFNPVYMQDRPVVIIAPPLHLHGATS